MNIQYRNRFVVLAIFAILASLLPANPVSAQENKSKVFFFSIQHVKGRCLTYHSEKASMVIRNCDGSREQMFYLDEFHQIIHAYGGCLTVTEFVNKSPLALKRCLGSTSQYWNFNNMMISSSGFCVDVPNWAANNSKVYLYQCHGATYQQFKFSQKLVKEGFRKEIQLEQTEDNCSTWLAFQRAQGLPLLYLPKQDKADVDFPVGTVKRGDEVVIEWGCGTNNVSRDRTRCPSMTNHVWIVRNRGKEFVTNCHLVLYGIIEQ